MSGGLNTGATYKETRRFAPVQAHDSTREINFVGPVHHRGHGDTAIQVVCGGRHFSECTPLRIIGRAAAPRPSIPGAEAFQIAGHKAFNWPVRRLSNGRYRRLQLAGMATKALYRRIAESTLAAALSDTPVVLIHGPRQSGKTTIAQRAGTRRKYPYYTFDDATTLAAARADITGFVARLGQHAVLDEVQRVPELFAALKPVVDANRRSARFILIGSSNVLLVPRLSD